MADGIKNIARWRWQNYFPVKIREMGKKDAENGRISSLTYDQENGLITADTIGGFRCFAYIPVSYTECMSYEPWYSGQKFFFKSMGYEKDSRYHCSCSTGALNQFCRHVAGMMYVWEAEYGELVFEETPEEREERIGEELKRARLEALEKERVRKQENIFPAIQYLKPYVKETDDLVFFSPDQILENAETNEYEAELAEISIKKKKLPEVRVDIEYNHIGNQILVIQGESEHYDVSMIFSDKQILQLNCECRRAHQKKMSYWGDIEKEAFFCAHALPVYASAWNWIVREKPGDATDQKASTLLSVLTRETAIPELPEVKKIKKPDIELIPRIISDKNTSALQLSFTIGRTGERPFVLKSLAKMLDAVDDGAEFELSKKAKIDFSEETFTENSDKWYRLLASRARNIRAINRRLERSFYYSQKLSLGNTVPLEGSDLDVIYDLAEGSGILYQNTQRREEYHIMVAPGRPRAEISLAPIKARNGELIGINLSGSMPRLLNGNQYQYIVDEKQFGRVTAGDMKDLMPFRSIADKEGNFHCSIGVKKLPEFYFRVLPGLRSSDQILLDDRVGEIDSSILPAEPEFVFYIDLAEDRVTCRVSVQYGEIRITGGFEENTSDGMLRDRDQENRVIRSVEAVFEKRDPEEMVFFAEASEETIFRILTDGIQLLSRYGEVKGSDAFGTVKLKKVSMPKFSVEIEGGLLELSIRTRDLTNEELLELLGSYRRKKRWHRLKSGDFVDLRQVEELDEIEELSGSMDVSLDDLVKGSVKIPKFRALYVDRLLEGHDEIATARDKHFKSLVRSFRTIRDSDYDVPESLTDIVRPYQLYGFRWLSTLSEAGFGGILADEMGLGKTLQMLAFLKSRKDAGETHPALVVCPASLVYNWKEECVRFTEDLKVELLAGTLPQRKEILKNMGSTGQADLYVTSYDLLKRDIALYEKKFFSTIVLDEAQYIKNQKAAVTKAVKVLNGDRRFALTGTPIENRLSEMWSIFDFLMPGFLYNASEFASRFEGPIMKKKDAEATEKLSKMTAPFILRRKKTDVLKDLPEKLEEVQAQAMETDQRRLYDAQVVHMREMLGSFSGSGEEKIRVLAEITRLRQLCCDPSLLFEDYHGSSAKRTACVELIQRAIDGGHRMLVFSQFTSMLALLSEDLKTEGIPFYTLTGSTPKQERIRLVNEFNSGDVPVFLISLKAGGTGLNLTGADVVIHYDPWWNLAVQNQATDRAHRIGQTRQVTVIKLIAADSIEEKIIKLQEAKRDLADAIMGGEGGSLMSMSREELLELLE